jgi:hypothetical protein
VQRLEADQTTLTKARLDHEDHKLTEREGQTSALIERQIALKGDKVPVAKRLDERLVEVIVNVEIPD